MKSFLNTGVIQKKARDTGLIIQALVLTLAGFAPLLLADSASAASLSSRKVTISTSKASATNVDYDFTFSWGSSTTVQSIVLEFCTTPLGTCVKPTGMDVSNDQTSIVSQANFPNNGTAFTETAANSNGCSDTGTGSGVTQYCADRTEATSATGTNASFKITGVTNPSLSTAFTTVYSRVTLYSDAAFTTSVYDGVVAASINRQLTVNGRVQERLNFCVAAIGDGGNTDTTMPASLSACSALSSTTVDLGVVDNTSIAKSPVDNSPPSSLGNDQYGIAMVDTNASNGVAVTFFSEPDSTGTNQQRAFRVTGATCDALTTNLLDQCFQSAGGDTSGGTAFSAGTEDFGMNIPCINVGGTTTALTADADFDNFDATTTSTADCENTDAGVTFAWNDTSTATPIASSTGVVDRETIKLNFGATAAATTPTGSYTAISTYIATPTF